MALVKVQTPKVTGLPKVKLSVPTAPKVPAIAKPPKAPKPATQAQGQMSPLFGQKRSRPTIQSVPTRTPSF